MDWENPANWSANPATSGYPGESTGNSDSVIIAVTSPAYPTIQNTGDITLGGKLTLNNAILDVNNATLTIEGAGSTLGGNIFSGRTGSIVFEENVSTDSSIVFLWGLSLEEITFNKTLSIGGDFRVSASRSPHVTLGPVFAEGVDSVMEISTKGNVTFGGDISSGSGNFDRVEFDLGGGIFTNSLPNITAANIALNVAGSISQSTTTALVGDNLTASNSSANMDLQGDNKLGGIALNAGGGAL